jgi:hypothetical protein
MTHDRIRIQHQDARRMGVRRWLGNAEIAVALVH